MNAVQRPRRPQSPWEGFEYVAAANEGWRVASGRRCRWMMPGRRSCKQPSVAEVNRSWISTRENWWAYCGAHLYGNWIENGQVMHWILRKTGGES